MKLVCIRPLPNRLPQYNRSVPCETMPFIVEQNNYVRLCRRAKTSMAAVMARLAAAEGSGTADTA